MDDPPVRRRFVKADPYAIADIGREHRLRSIERFMLRELTMLADPRSHDWTGTLHQLHWHTGAAVETLTRALDKLASRGLIAIEEPFVQNGAGIVAVLAFDDLVIPETRGRPRGSPDRILRPKPEESEGETSEIPENPTNEQEEQPNRRFAVAEGVGGSTDVPLARESIPTRPALGALSKRRAVDVEPIDDATLTEAWAEALTEAFPGATEVAR